MSCWCRLFSPVLSRFLSFPKLIIEFWKRKEQKEVVNVLRKKIWNEKKTCLLVVNSFSFCSINCNVAFVHLHVVPTASSSTSTFPVVVHLIAQLSGLCKVHVVWAHSFYCYCECTATILWWKRCCANAKLARLLWPRSNMKCTVCVELNRNCRYVFIHFFL